MGTLLMLVCGLVCFCLGLAAGYSGGYTDGLKVAEDMMNMLCETLANSFTEFTDSRKKPQL